MRLVHTIAISLYICSYSIKECESIFEQFFQCLALDRSLFDHEIVLYHRSGGFVEPVGVASSIRINEKNVLVTDKKIAQYCDDLYIKGDVYDDYEQIAFCRDTYSPNLLLLLVGPDIILPHIEYANSVDTSNQFAVIKAEGFLTKVFKIPNWYPTNYVKLDDRNSFIDIKCKLKMRIGSSLVVPWGKDGKHKLTGVFSKYDKVLGVSRFSAVSDFLLKMQQDDRVVQDPPKVEPKKFVVRSDDFDQSLFDYVLQLPYNIIPFL